MSSTKLDSANEGGKYVFTSMTLLFIQRDHAGVGRGTSTGVGGTRARRCAMDAG